MISLLRNRDYFWLWLGQSISQVGDSVRDWAMVFWIYKASGHSPVVQALAFMAVIAPDLLVGPAAGVWVDRWDRRKVMLYADAVRGFLSLTMAAAALTGHYYIALALVCLGSCVGQFFGPARGAMIPRVVGKEHLVQANSLAQTTVNLIQLTGPAMGTALFLALGPMACFLADSASFFVSALCIAMVRTSGAVPACGAGESFLSEFREGIAFCWSSTPIRAMIVAVTVLGAGAGAINSLMIFLVRGGLGLGESAMVGPSTAQPVAALAVALTIGAAARRLKRAPLLVAAGAALGAIGIGTIAAAPNIYWVVAGSVIVGACNVLLNIGLSTTAQTLVPDQMRGRVLSTVMALPTAAMLLSAAVSGGAARITSPRIIMGVAAGFLGLAALLAYTGLRNVGLSAAPDVAPAVGE